MEGGRVRVEGRKEGRKEVGGGREGSVPVAAKRKQRTGLQCIS